MDGLVGYSPWGHKELAMTEATEHACIYLVSGTVDLRHWSSDLVLWFPLVHVQIFRSHDWEMSYHLVQLSIQDPTY